eukprot:CAMPEP_0172577160 /NCGR_PEP_ID=MMETSP1067-20121228/138092_1 /TAXON_ID=265564 ORGANISM="Thalassiosira punctigera, Strain Tpunct2005C2" /NCGR_SAMPLE_ID=MMETSP1067 /ASSEMBLY_ACC=CAM_ASM_000444 /LENGTH=269 /DNA_ID=CAMNT_0013369845 /DNA_START=1530 /DNA_END=2335 /DNA_ORIENTATION=+
MPTPMEAIMEDASVGERSSLHRELLGMEGEETQFSKVHISKEVAPLRETDDLLVEFGDCCSTISNKDDSDFDDLLVDFPNRSQPSWSPFIDDSCSVASGSIAARRGVSFSDRTQVMFVDNLAVDYKQDLWLTETDIENCMAERSEHIELIQILQRFSGPDHRGSPVARYARQVAREAETTPIGLEAARGHGGLVRRAQSEEGGAHERRPRRAVAAEEGTEGSGAKWSRGHREHVDGGERVGAGQGAEDRRVPRRGRRGVHDDPATGAAI